MLHIIHSLANIYGHTDETIFNGNDLHYPISLRLVCMKNWPAWGQFVHAVFCHSQSFIGLTSERVLYIIIEATVIKNIQASITCCLLLKKRTINVTKKQIEGNHHKFKDKTELHCLKTISRKPVTSPCGKQAKRGLATQRTWGPVVL